MNGYKQPCNDIIIAKTEINNLKEDKAGVRDELNHIHTCLGEIKASTDELAKHRLKTKHWPEHLKNENNNNKTIMLRIKEEKYKIISGLIIFLTLVGGYFFGN